MAAQTQYEVPSWRQIYAMLLKQAAKIQADGYQPDTVVGIARGGLMPSRILADLLGARDFAVITIEYYVGIAQTKREPILKQCLPQPLHGKRVLLVDDVSDGGRSLQLARRHLQEQSAEEIKIATVYCKPGTITLPDYYEKETSRWIVFPWEARETLTNIKRRCSSEQSMRQEVANLVKAGFPQKLAAQLLKEGENDQL